MLERAIKVLRIACLVLAAAVAYELAQMAPRVNPLARVTIPALPTLPAGKTNTIADGANAAGSIKLAATGPNKTNEIIGTNGPSPKVTNAADTNSTVVMALKPTTNSASREEANVAKTVNLGGTVPAGSNNINALEASTNVPKGISSAQVLTNAGTNLIKGTNLLPSLVAGGTNDSNSLASSGTGTNGSAAGRVRNGRNGSNGPAVIMAGMGPGGRGGVLPELAADIKARVDRVYESEILGQAMRPLPMALIGIAGDVAILRSASGQTGLVKEGDSLGDLKLLRIGINRVLVEQNARKQELTIFDGYGGTSLMPPEKNNKDAPAPETVSGPQAKSLKTKEKPE